MGTSTVQHACAPLGATIQQTTTSYTTNSLAAVAAATRGSIDNQELRTPPSPGLSTAKDEPLASSLNPPTQPSSREGSMVFSAVREPIGVNDIQQDVTPACTRSPPRSTTRQTISDMILLQYLSIAILHFPDSLQALMDFAPVYLRTEIARRARFTTADRCPTPVTLYVEIAEHTYTKIDTVYSDGNKTQTLIHNNSALIALHSTSNQRLIKVEVNPKVVFLGQYNIELIKNSTLYKQYDGTLSQIRDSNNAQHLIFSGTMTRYDQHGGTTQQTCTSRLIGRVVNGEHDIW